MGLTPTSEWFVVDEDHVVHRPTPSERMTVDKFTTRNDVDYTDDDYDEQRYAALTNVFGDVVVRVMCGGFIEIREIVDYGQVTCIGCLVA